MQGSDIIDELYKLGFRVVTEDLSTGKEYRFSAKYLDAVDLRDLLSITEKYGLEIMLIEPYRDRLIVRLVEDGH